MKQVAIGNPAPDVVISPNTANAPDTHITAAALTFRQNNFNVLRVLLAISVIFSHCFPVLYGPLVLDPIARLLRYQKDVPEDHAIDLGHLALYGFFAISGYLVTMSWRNTRWQGGKGIGDYLKKRILRIYPGFLAVSAFDLFVVGPLGADNRGQYWHSIHLAHPSFYISLLTLNLQQPPVFSHMPVAGSVNASLWTIQLEFKCYLMVALLGTAAILLRQWIPRKFVRTAPLLLFAVVYVVYYLCCGGQLATVISSINLHPASGMGHLLTKFGAGEGVIPRMFLYFISGMCFYLYRDFVSYRWEIALAALCVLLGSIYGLPIVAYTIPIAGVYLLLYIAFRPSRWAKFGTNTDLSYGLYLYAFPIQQLLTLYFKPHLTVLTLFASALLITSVMAYLSWHFVERPSLRLKRRPLLPELKTTP